MNIEDIVKDINVISSYIPNELMGARVLSLCHNSKYATPYCAFFCKKGARTDGHEYAKYAYENGARIFIAEHDVGLPSDAAIIITPNASDALNRLALIFYNYPAKELKIIGITGTKGKTTVAISAYKIASSNGICIGYIGTNGVYYNGKEFETANTTPDVLELQKILRRMRDDGVEAVILEISSQALAQNRIFGLEFESCIFTNLYHDHIGGIEHPTFEHYRNSKKKLFTEYKAKNIIINADSEYGEYMAYGVKCSSLIRVSAHGNEGCDMYASNPVKFKTDAFLGMSFQLHISGTDKQYNVFMPVPGIYSVENGLLIISICMSLGIKLENILNVLASVSVPGRFEIVPLKSKPNSLFVIDYAHNGASLKAVIDALREYEPNRLICLFGSVGGRTFLRRAELGAVAEENADVIIITSDNPDFENPMNIINEIRAAMGDTEKPVYMISDRADAVKKAYELAEDGDYILLAGKGHESCQIICGRSIPFSERRILEEADLNALITYH